MNPILLRYAGVALVAVIAGAGGGYLAVNKKTSPPPITESGTIPAIPAQPFPGEGIPAIPAVPAEHPRPPRGDAPFLSATNLSKCSLYRTTPEDAYCFAPSDEGGGYLRTQTGLTITGYNFTEHNNAIMWDKAVIDRVQSYEEGTKLSSLTPSGQKACSLHDLAVKTIFGTSNNLQIKLVDPGLPSPFWFLGISSTGEYKKTSGSVGEEIDMRVMIPDDPKYYSLDLYAQFTKYSGKSYLWAGEAMTPLAVVKWPSSFSGGGDAVYRLKIPQEVNQCPTNLYPQCAGSRFENKMIALTPGEYGIQIIVMAKGQCSVSVHTAFGFPAFTITEK